MAETDFLGKLRMANIFPPGGGPFQPPDLSQSAGPDMNQIFNMIHRSRDMDQQRGLNLDNEMRMRDRQEKIYAGNNLQNIAQESMNPNNQNKQVLFKDSPKSNAITPYQQAQLNLSEKRLGQSGDLGQERIDTTRRGQDISRDRLTETIDVNNERQPNALELIGARGAVGDQQIDRRGAITSDQIDQRGGIQDRQIEARAKNSRDLQASGAVNTSNQINQRETNLQSRPIAASQVGNDQDNKIRQLTLTRPDLAKYITQDTGGRISIAPDAPLGALSEINRVIYGKSGPDTSRNINLPSNKSSSPKSVGNDPLGIRGLP